MKEQCVLFNTAELAKECGFDWMQAGACYYKGEFFINQNLIALEYPELKGKNYHNNVTAKLIFAPTQSLLQKWMRDTYKVFIHVERQSIGSDEWVFSFESEHLPVENWEDKRRASSFIPYSSFSLGFETYSGGWDTYEEALEKGLQYGLELIKKH